MNHSSFRKALAVSGLLVSALAAQAQVTLTQNLAASPGTITDTDEHTYSFVAVPSNYNHASVEIQNVQLRLALTTSANTIQDFKVTLTSPGGVASVFVFNELSTFNDGGGTHSFADVLFSDSGTATLDVPSGTGTSFPGPYRAQNTLTTPFTSLTAAQIVGTWTIKIQDITSGSTDQLFKNGETAAWGTAVGTQLILTVPEPSTYAMIFGLGALGFAAIRRYRVKTA